MTEEREVEEEELPKGGMMARLAGLAGCLTLFAW